MQKTSFFTLILMLIRIDNHYMFVVDLFGKGSDQKVRNKTFIEATTLHVLYFL